MLEALGRELARDEIAAETDLLSMAASIAERAKGHVDLGESRHGIEPGAIRDAIGVRPGTGAQGPFVDVGVLPSEELTIGETKPQRAAVPLEFGHVDGSTHVRPFPFMRPAIADEIAARSNQPVAE